MSQAATAILPPLEIAAKTDTGQLRSLNEDSIATVEELGLMVLADGMGGYQSGDIASSFTTRIVVDGLTRGLPEATGNIAELVQTCVKRANRAIFQEGQQRTERARNSNQSQGMGSTVALMLFRNQRITIAHVGDSRVYRLRDGRLELLTHDHSLLQEQIDLGIISAEAAANSHNRHLVTRGLGLEAEVDVSIEEVDIQAGDIYLACSDGLNDMVDNVDIERVLVALQANLPLAASQLIMIANDNGGEDNISVILAKVGHPSLPASKINGFFSWLFGR